MQKPTLPPVLQMHSLSADCVLWLLSRRSSRSSTWESALLTGLVSSCICIVRKCLQTLWQLKEEVPNSALGSRGLMGEVGTPVRRYTWDSLVLITPGGGSKSPGELKKIFFYYGKSHII